MTLGKKIETLRARDGLTQNELALKIGVSQMMVSYYEHDYKNPSFEVAIRLAKTFNVSLDYLAQKEI